MKARRLFATPSLALTEPVGQENQKVSEAQQWINFKNGSEAAYRTIYTTYFPVLYNYGRQFCSSKALVKDCIQEIFVTLWLTREKLGPTDSIKYYLFKALKRSIIRARRQEQRQHHLLAQIPPFENVHSVEQCLIRNQEAEEQKRELRRAVNQLTDQQREAVFLIFYEGMSYAQTAELLSVKAKTARNLIGKALRSLRQYLGSLPYLLWLSFLG